MNWENTKAQEQFISSLNARLTELERQQTLLAQEATAIKNLITINSPEEVQKKKSTTPAKQKEVRKREGGNKQEQLVDIAINLIKTGGKPCHTSDVMKAAKEVGLSSASVYTYLSNEVCKSIGSRLRKVGTGYYDLSNIKRVEGAMSQEEFRQKVHEAKSR